MPGDRTGVNAQPQVIQSGIKKGPATVDLTTNDIFDRIINLRFIHKPLTPGAVPRSWTIRSDYEVQYWPGGMQYIVIKQKPSIKVSLKYVSNKVAVNINIDVQNLFIKNPVDLDTREPLQYVEIQMGYRSQFPNWVNDPAYVNLDRAFFDSLFDGTQQTGKPEIVPPTKIMAQVLSTERLSNPPDMTTRFVCVIGTQDDSLSWLYDSNPKVLSEQVSRQRSSFWLSQEPVNLLPSTFFLLLTRRFIRTNVQHDVSYRITQPSPGAPQVIEQIVTIYDNQLAPVKQLVLEDGRLSASDADAYGVIVYMSNVLWDTPLQELPRWGLEGKQKEQAVPIKHQIPTELYNRMDAQMKAICQEFPFIRFFALGDGNFYAYHVLETENGYLDFFKSSFINGKQSSKGKIVKLPAVYDIQWGGTRTIRMPYFSGILPMTTVAFSARYALNNLVGNFYKPQPGHVFFLVLLMDVVFGTMGQEDNEMTLTCTDIQGPQTPTTLPDGAVVPAPSITYTPPPTRSKTWAELTLTVVEDYDGNPNQTDTTWATLVNRLIASAQGETALWGTAPPNAAEAIAALEEWNPSIFTTSRISTYYSPESNNYGVPLPRLFSKWNPVSAGNPDQVIIRVPFWPTDADYKPEEKMS